MGVMAMENQASEVRVSNWTRATGTRPFERHVDFPVSARRDAGIVAAVAAPAAASGEWQDDRTVVAFALDA